ncbi:hypothetical protein FHS18_002754 [Paenibacillus phyllosphaerae]|uniref:Uncharacterized protein n=1 Tax=Paenibacillus phyllosphaerae TaxID=274593 RepID=A0A7W5AY15_9BACL|nr:hypothetical protein [Paenibacillus phyllosphaerae]MBB3110687.1 hypothetical protein [Paenibacillus phyllosphaerae]
MNDYRLPYCYPYPTYPYYYAQPVHADYRELPPVDTKIFEKSVHSFPRLMQDGTKLLQKLGEPAFAYQLMVASQASQQDKVNAMLHTVGTSQPIKTHYTPSGVTFTLESDGCALHMALRWGD